MVLLKQIKGVKEGDQPITRVLPSSQPKMLISISHNQLNHKYNVYWFLLCQSNFNVHVGLYKNIAIRAEANNIYNGWPFYNQ